MTNKERFDALKVGLGFFAWMALAVVLGLGLQFVVGLF